ncbi:MAG: hypothetical protein FWE48_02200 [Coriobacteriia bacterium]|nr:hypothetical protein [Coriobacteriia bacterium]
MGCNFGDDCSGCSFRSTFDCGGYGESDAEPSGALRHYMANQRKRERERAEEVAQAIRNSVLVEQDFEFSGTVETVGFGNPIIAIRASTIAHTLISIIFKGEAEEKYQTIPFGTSCVRVSGRLYLDANRLCIDVFDMGQIKFLASPCLVVDDSVFDVEIEFSYLADLSVDSVWRTRSEDILRFDQVLNTLKT